MLFVATLVILFLASLTGVSAETDGFQPVAYRLLPGSTYQQGCFDPCSCPIFEPLPMDGTLELELLPTAGPLDQFAIRNVDWTVEVLDKRITGHGFYTLAGDSHQLNLDVQINRERPIHFSSELVDGAQLPLIDITITMNQFICYDIVMHVVAAPAPPSTSVLSVGPSSLAWTPAPDGTVLYDVVCGDLTYLRASAGDFTAATDLCLANDLAANYLDYSMPTTTGEGLWFLMRPDPDGSYDSGSATQQTPRDLPILASPLACPSP